MLRWFGNQSEVIEGFDDPGSGQISRCEECWWTFVTMALTSLDVCGFRGQEKGDAAASPSLGPKELQSSTGQGYICHTSKTDGDHKPCKKTTVHFSLDFSPYVVGY
jgi:hypothetical protein